jgi:hypothetical protein
MIPGSPPPSRGVSPAPKLHIIPLNALKSKSEFITQTSATTHAPPALIHGVWNTLSLLASRSTSLSYSPTHCTLVASLGGNKAELASHTLSFLEELTRASYEVASTLLCGSVLAGRTSESDEYGDVGVWIGDLKHGTALDVLKRLGLDSWLRQGAKVGPGSHSLCISSQKPLMFQVVSSPTLPSPLPAAVASTEGYVSPPFETPQIHLEALSQLLSNIESPFEFRVEGLSGGYVIYFLCGKLSHTRGGFAQDEGYAGLVGVGVSADLDE